MLITIKKDSTNVQAVILAQSMLLAAKYTVKIDGDFGKNTETLVLLFQTKNNLVSDGIIGEKTWQVLFLKASSYLTKTAEKFLGEQDLLNAATLLGIEVAAIKAVNEVESRGQGFVDDFPVILFERHLFWKRLKKHGVNPASVVKNNRDILSTKAGGYKNKAQEIKRLKRAMKIHPQAAMESASWGLFQVLGKHWKKLNYSSIENFVANMQESEAKQLDVFVRYIKAFECDQHLKLKNGASKLRLRNFEKFAACYNGPAFKKNFYHTRMLRAYTRYKKYDHTNGVQLEVA